MKNRNKSKGEKVIKNQYQYQLIRSRINDQHLQRTIIVLDLELGSGRQLASNSRERERDNDTKKKAYHSASSRHSDEYPNIDSISTEFKALKLTITPASLS